MASLCRHLYINLRHMNQGTKSLFDIRLNYDTHMSHMLVRLGPRGRHYDIHMSHIVVCLVPRGSLQRSSTL